jgi:hypothetical protein
MTGFAKKEAFVCVCGGTRIEFRASFLIGRCCPLEPPTVLLFFVFQIRSPANLFLGLVLNHSPPISASGVAGISN